MHEEIWYDDDQYDIIAKVNKLLARDTTAQIEFDEEGGEGFEKIRLVKGNQ